MTDTVSDASFFEHIQQRSVGPSDERMLQLRTGDDGVYLCFQVPFFPTRSSGQYTGYLKVEKEGATLGLEHYLEKMVRPVSLEYRPKMSGEQSCYEETSGERYRWANGRHGLFGSGISWSTDNVGRGFTELIKSCADAADEAGGSFILRGVRYPFETNRSTGVTRTATIEWSYRPKTALTREEPTVVLSLNNGWVSRAERWENMVEQAVGQGGCPRWQIKSLESAVGFTDAATGASDLSLNSVGPSRLSW